MTATPELAAYCRRIGFEGAPKADLATLGELHRLHPAAIAFENIDTLLGRPVSLELSDVEAKLVGARRGGYCFEQNRLFAAVLEACGFDVECLAARVVWNRELEAPLPRTHMLISVSTPAGERLCDVGFGGLTMTAPLELTPGVEQRAGDTVLRLVAVDAVLELQARVGGTWKPMYRFDRQPQLPIDFEMMNHFVGTHPSSHFRTTLIGGRVTDAGRYGLANNRFTHYRPDGSREERTARSAAELHGMLSTQLGIEIGLDDALAAALERCIG